jgi:hypothetical protein
VWESYYKNTQWKAELILKEAYSLSVLFLPSVYIIVIASSDDEFIGQNM